MAKRVFVGWTHALFHRSIRLLLNDPDIQLIGDCQDLAAAKTELKILQPDTIILEIPDGFDGFRGLANAFEWVSWNPRIICASLTDNTVWTVRQEQIVLQESDELLRLILGT